MLDYRYTSELEKLRPDDQVQMQYPIHGYIYLDTMAHGYLVIPKNDNNYKIAESIVDYGYIGELGIYLEQDVEMNIFLNKILERK